MILLQHKTQWVPVLLAALWRKHSMWTLSSAGDFSIQDSSKADLSQSSQMNVKDVIVYVEDLILNMFVHPTLCSCQHSCKEHVP